MTRHLFLVDPVVLGLLPALDLALLEPESNLLLGRLDGVGAVADVAADVLRESIRQHTNNDGARREALTMAKSPRMVPGLEARGLVAPRIMRPVLTTSRPSQTMAQIGPLPMSVRTIVSLTSFPSLLCVLR